MITRGFSGTSGSNQFMNDCLEVAGIVPPNDPFDVALGDTGNVLRHVDEA